MHDMRSFFFRRRTRNTTEQFRKHLSHISQRFLCNLLRYRRVSLSLFRRAELLKEPRRESYRVRILCGRDAFGKVQNERRYLLIRFCFVFHRYTGVVVASLLSLLASFSFLTGVLFYFFKRVWVISQNRISRHRQTHRAFNQSPQLCVVVRTRRKQHVNKLFRHVLLLLRTRTRRQRCRRAITPIVSIPNVQILPPQLSRAQPQTRFAHLRKPLKSHHAHLRARAQ